MILIVVLVHPVAADGVEIGDRIDVRPDDRFVDSGDVVSAAGVSAGIDMALHLVARLDSTDRAEWVRRHMQYETPLYVS